MNERLARIALRVLQIGIPLTFLTPFVYLSTVTFPFVTGKVWVFRALVEFLLAFWVILLLVKPEYRPRRQPLLVAVALFLGALFLASIFGVDAWRSMWSNHERMTGVFTILHYGLLTFMAATVYRGRAAWTVPLVVLVACGGLMSMLGLWERYHPGFFANPGTEGRVWGTLGNYIYLANYLLFSLYFTALLLFRRETPSALRVWLSILAAVQIVVLIFTDTRGTTLAIALTALILLGWLAVSQKRFRAWGIAGAAVLILVAGTLVLFREQPWAQSLPGVGRILATLSGQVGGVQTRFIAWEIAGKAVLDRPLLGWGPENFYYAFNQYYNPESYRFSQYETWFDRVHNTILEVFATTGVVGGAAYFAVLGLAFWTLIRSVRAGRLKGWEGMLTGGMLVAYVLQNLTVFDSHSSYLYYFLLLGFIAGTALPPAGTVPERAGTRGAVALGAGAVVLTVGVLAIVMTNVLPYQANALGLYGTATFRYGPDAKAAMGLYERALALPSPYRSDVQNDAVREGLRRIGDPRLTREQATELALWVEALARENLADQPKDVYRALLLAEVLMANSATNRERLAEAEALLQAARPLSPDRQQIIFALARLALINARAQDAVALLEESRAKEERVGETHWYLSLAYNDANRPADAVTALLRMRELGYTGRSGIGLEYSISILLGAGKIAEAEEDARMYIEATGDSPAGGRAHLLLAKVLAAKGDRAGAAGEAAIAMRLDPQLAPQATALIVPTP